MNEELLLDAVRTFHVFARRYCDGRMSYAPSMFNRMVERLKDAGVKLETPDGTPWARDGRDVQQSDQIPHEDLEIHQGLQIAARITEDYCYCTQGSVACVSCEIRKAILAHDKLITSHT